MSDPKATPEAKRIDQLERALKSLGSRLSRSTDPIVKSAAKDLQRELETGKINKRD